MNEQPEFVSSLGGTGNFFAVPKQVTLLMAGKAVAMPAGAAVRGEPGLHGQFGERQAQPFMNAPVTLFRLERVPFMVRGKGDAVGPIRVMRHEAAAGWTPDERTQMRGGFNLGKLLKIAKGRRRPFPAVKAQNRAAKSRQGFEQRFIECHVERRVALAGVEQKPVHI